MNLKRTQSSSSVRSTCSSFTNEKLNSDLKEMNDRWMNLKQSVSMSLKKFKEAIPLLLQYNNEEKELGCWMDEVEIFLRDTQSINQDYNAQLLEIESLIKDFSTMEISKNSIILLSDEFLEDAENSFGEIILQQKSKINNRWNSLKICLTNHKLKIENNLKIKNQLNDFKARLEYFETQTEKLNVENEDELIRSKELYIKLSKDLIDCKNNHLHQLQNFFNDLNNAENKNYENGNNEKDIFNFRNEFNLLVNNFQIQSDKIISREVLFSEGEKEYFEYKNLLTKEEKYLDKLRDNLLDTPISLDVTEINENIKNFDKMLSCNDEPIIICLNKIFEKLVSSNIMTSFVQILNKQIISRRQELLSKVDSKMENLKENLEDAKLIQASIEELKKMVADAKIKLNKDSIIKDLVSNIVLIEDKFHDSQVIMNKLENKHEIEQTKNFRFQITLLQKDFEEIKVSYQEKMERNEQAIQSHVHFKQIDPKLHGETNIKEKLILYTTDSEPVKLTTFENIDAKMEEYLNFIYNQHVIEQAECDEQVASTLSMMMIFEEEISNMMQKFKINNENMHLLQNKLNNVKDKAEIRKMSLVRVSPTFIQFQKMISELDEELTVKSIDNFAEISTKFRKIFEETSNIQNGFLEAECLFSLQQLLLKFISCGKLTKSNIQNIFDLNLKEVKQERTNPSIKHKTSIAEAIENILKEPKQLPKQKISNNCSISTEVLLFNQDSEKLIDNQNEISCKEIMDKLRCLRMKINEIIVFKNLPIVNSMNDDNLLDSYNDKLNEKSLIIEAEQLLRDVNTRCDSLSQQSKALQMNSVILIQKLQSIFSNHSASPLSNINFFESNSKVEIPTIPSVNLHLNENMNRPVSSETSFVFSISDIQLSTMKENIILNSPVNFDKCLEDLRRVEDWNRSTKKIISQSGNGNLNNMKRQYDSVKRLIATELKQQKLVLDSLKFILSSHIETQNDQTKKLKTELNIVIDNWNKTTCDLTRQKIFLENELSRFDLINNSTDSLNKISQILENENNKPQVIEGLIKKGQSDLNAIKALLHSSNNWSNEIQKVELRPKVNLQLNRPVLYSARSLQISAKNHDKKPYVISSNLSNVKSDEDKALIANEYITGLDKQVEWLNQFEDGAKILEKVICSANKWKERELAATPTSITKEKIIRQVQLEPEVKMISHFVSAVGQERSMSEELDEASTNFCSQVHRLIVDNNRLQGNMGIPVQIEQLLKTKNIDLQSVNLELENVLQTLNKLRKSNKTVENFDMLNAKEQRLRSCYDEAKTLCSARNIQLDELLIESRQMEVACNNVSIAMANISDAITLNQDGIKTEMALQSETKKIESQILNLLEVVKKMEIRYKRDNSLHLNKLLNQYLNTNRQLQQRLKSFPPSSSTKIAVLDPDAIKSMQKNIAKFEQSFEDLLNKDDDQDEDSIIYTDAIDDQKTNLLRLEENILASKSKIDDKLKLSEDIETKEIINNILLNYSDLLNRITFEKVKLFERINNLNSNHAVETNLARVLSAPWQRAVVASTRVPYFINHRDEITQWNHPQYNSLFNFPDEINVKFAAYRTAMKLASLKKKLYFNLVPFKSVMDSLIEAKPASRVSICDCLKIIDRIFSNIALPGFELALNTDLTLNCVLNLFDSSRLGVIELASFKIFLISMSMGLVEEKYDAIYSEISGVTGINRDAIFLLISTWIQMARLVGEYHAFGPKQIEPTVKTCFIKVSEESVISKGMFLEWLKLEPQAIVWFQVLHRFELAAACIHPARCSTCSICPIVGFRFRCLKCLKYDMCQKCFFNGQVGKGHKLSHPMQEFHNASTSSDNMKCVSKILRNKLRSKRYFRTHHRIGYLPVSKSIDDLEATRSTASVPTPSNLTLNILPRSLTPELHFNNRINGKVKRNSRHVDDLRNNGNFSEALHHQLGILANRLAEVEKRKRECSPEWEDEHNLIANYCLSLNTKCSPPTTLKSPMQILMSVNNEDKNNIEVIIDELEEEERLVLSEYDMIESANRDLQEKRSKIIDKKIGDSKKCNSNAEKKGGEGGDTLASQRLTARMKVLRHRSQQIQQQLSKLKQMQSTNDNGVVVTYIDEIETDLKDKGSINKTYAPTFAQPTPDK